MNNKKLLILGGSSQHLKLVQAAKELGAYTIVTDYLLDSPCKSICDESWMFDVKDVDSIVDSCIKSKVNGVITGWLDICQIPYLQICQKLHLPCYGTESQFYRLTNKHAFKQLCKECEVGIIPEYTEEDVFSQKVKYPVFIKPVDSRGSRGQAVCYNIEDALVAIENAKLESTNGDCIIEQYIEKDITFQVTYFFIDGEPYILRTADAYNGSLENNLFNVTICSISPSTLYEKFIQTSHQQIVRMMHSIGYYNGPLMLQGFYDNGEFRFFDPGLRFPGVDYDILFRNVAGFDVMKTMVEFALTGNYSPTNIVGEFDGLKGKSAVVLFPTISAGDIGTIGGIDFLENDDTISSFSFRHSVGDCVQWTFDVNQRVAEIDAVCDNKDLLKDKIKEIYSNLQIINQKGENMIYCPIDTNRII